MGIYFPLLLGALVVLMLTAVITFVGQTPGPQNTYRRVALAPLSTLTWCMSAVFMLTGMLPLLPGLTSARALELLAAPILASFVVLGWLVWRQLHTMRTGDAYDGTPDAMWRAGGLVYYNPSDASVLVAKRYGFGWTLNFARPAAWAYVAATVSFLVLVAVLPVVLKSR
jgi:uncharacterized membrane protein